MADTGGIEALLRALNDSPALGAGLKPTRTAARSNTFAAAAGLSGATATVAPATTATATSTAAPAGTAPARPVRAAASLAGTQAKPKTIISDGIAYSTRAPRGTYLDLVI